jgi:hypothetical protein
MKQMENLLKICEEQYYHKLSQKNKTTTIEWWEKPSMSDCTIVYTYYVNKYQV